MSAVRPEFHDSTGDNPAPNKLFGYEILGSLAHGAGSMLYYVQPPDSDLVRVLKHVTIGARRDKRFYEQLRTEFLISRRLEHPGLRRSIDMHVRRNWVGSVVEAALILERCEGVTLDQYVPPNTTERICIFLRAAMAVAALNDLGYVHCDIKPSNIVITDQARAKVIDLGQACKIGSAKYRIQGTPNYMAPEQTRRDEMTARTDVFCFGATMYSALTRQALPTLMTVGKRRKEELKEDNIRAPNTFDPSIPEDLSALVMDCVQYKPKRRPRDMHEVANRLRAAGLASISRLEAGAPSPFDAGI